MLHINNLKKVLYPSLALPLLLGMTSCSHPVFAYSDSNNKIENVENLSWDAYDPLSWNQNNASDMPLSWLGTQYLDGTSGLSFPEDADLLYTYTFLAIKTNTKKLGYIPSYANADLERIHAFANGLPHLGAEGIFTNGWTADLQDNGSQFQTGVTLEDARSAWKEGKLVVLQVKYPGYTDEHPIAHFLAIDSVEDNGDVYVFDSVSPASKFSDAYRSNDIVSMITLTSDKAKSYKLPKLWEMRGATDIYAKDGKADPGVLGGGGAVSKETSPTEPENYEASELDQNLGTYKPSNDAPDKLKKGNKAPQKATKVPWVGLTLFTGLALSLGGGAFWFYRRNRN